MGKSFVGPTNLMSTARGITTNTPANCLPAVPPERAGPEHIFLRRPPNRHRTFWAHLAGGMPRLHYHLADSVTAAAGNGEVVVLGPPWWILNEYRICFNTTCKFRGKWQGERSFVLMLPESFGP